MPKLEKSVNRVWESRLNGLPHQLGRHAEEKRPAFALYRPTGVREEG